jgi:hypothetical protein
MGNRPPVVPVSIRIRPRSPRGFKPSLAWADTYEWPLQRGARRGGLSSGPAGPMAGALQT